MEQKFEVIVVGAGPAGCACVYKLAQAGVQVLVVERGRFPGAKNTWGGAYFGPTLSQLFPDFYKEAPFERFVAFRKLSALSDDSCLTLDFTTERFSKLPYDGIILLRTRFDQWFASKVEGAGAAVASGLHVDGPVIQDGRVAGIMTDGDRILSDVVVACDGVNSILAQQAGLRGELLPHQVKQGVKEVIALPRETIEARFGLTGDEGVVWEFFGTCTRGVPGGGYICTNKESLSVGVVAELSALVECRVTANELLEGFKSHPLISRFVKDGKLVEYAGHLIPSGGLNMMPRLYGDGILVAGDAAGMTVGTGPILEGANFAVASGVAAAETILKAREAKDFSALSLADYEQRLRQGFVLKDLQTFKGSAQFLENRRLYSTYPDVACDFAKRMLSNDGEPRKLAWQLFREAMKGRTSAWQLARDALRGRKAL